MLPDIIFKKYLMAIVLTDPIEVKLSQANLFKRWVCPLLNDVRDLVFIHLSLTFICIN